MSGGLARTALRLAGIEAIAADPVVAAACAGRIYDSLIGSFQSEEPVPVIVLATEDDHGEAYSTNNGGPPFDQMVDVTLEITVCAFVANGTDEIDIFVPATTRESEMLIDLLENRAVDALTIGDTAAAQLLRREVVRRVTAYRSLRYASEDTGVKLARRLVTLTVALKGDDGGDLLDEPTGPFAALPNPLRAVADALPPGSSGLATCQALAAKLAAPVAGEPFAGADVAYAPQRLVPFRTPSDTDRVEAFAQEIDLPCPTPPTDAS